MALLYRYAVGQSTRWAWGGHRRSFAPGRPAAPSCTPGPRLARPNTSREFVATRGAGHGAPLIAQCRCGQRSGSPRTGRANLLALGRRVITARGEMGRPPSNRAAGCELCRQPGAPVTGRGQWLMSVDARDPHLLAAEPMRLDVLCNMRTAERSPAPTEGACPERRVSSGSAIVGG